MRRETSLNRGVRQRASELRQCHAAYFFFVEFEIVAESGRYFFQHTNRLRDDFRTNSVSGKGSDAELHGRIPTIFLPENLPLMTQIVGDIAHIYR